MRRSCARWLSRPVELVRQAVLSAAEVTNAILRIDDIIARRGME